MARHRSGELPAAAAARELGLSRARFYKLYSHYLRACAQGQAEVWAPARSGGDHHPAWPDNVTALLTKLLASKPPSSYSAAASELHRRLQFEPKNRSCGSAWGGLRQGFFRGFGRLTGEAAQELPGRLQLRRSCHQPRAQPFVAGL